MPESKKWPWKDNDLRPITRVITDHDENGNSVFSSEIPEELPGKSIGAPALFRLGYCTDESPVTMTDNKDLHAYAKYLKEPPGLIIPGGTVARYVDLPPDATSPMHRTVSLDYGVVLEGEIEVLLDSGETRLLKRGDMAIQRGTMHAWHNTSKTEWARMLYFLQESKPLEIGGTKLTEDYGTMTGVRKSAN